MLERPDVNALDVGELADSERSAFAPVAGMLDPAERHPRVGADTLVDVRKPSLEIFGGDPPAAVEVGRDPSRAQSEFARIGDPQRVALVLGGDDCGDRTEPFLVMRRL